MWIRRTKTKWPMSALVTFTSARLYVRRETGNWLHAFFRVFSPSVTGRTTRLYPALHTCSTTPTRCSRRMTSRMPSRTTRSSLRALERRYVRAFALQTQHSSPVSATFRIFSRLVWCVSVHEISILLHILVLDLIDSHEHLSLPQSASVYDVH